VVHLPCCFGPYQSCLGLFQVLGVGVIAAAFVSRGICKVVASPVPLVVVGNISVGGTGKTPLTQALVKLANHNGLAAGIVSRGHGGQAHAEPVVVQSSTSAASVGDEPLLHHLKTGAPVVVCTDRAAAVAKLAQNGVGIAFSDDGLQHYRMQRTAEIAVVDGDAGFANGLLLPSGPLRESVKRLGNVDIVAVQVNAANGHLDTSSLVQAVPSLQVAVDAGVAVGSFYLQAQNVRQLQTGETTPLSTLESLLAGKSVTAMAGIGSPERFFNSLERAGLAVQRMPLGDHHDYSESDFTSVPSGAVIVTGKDAVKLKSLSLPEHDIYELEVVVQLSAKLEQAVQTILSQANKR